MGILISRDKLTEGLHYRFGVDLNDVEYALERAIEVGAVVVLENGLLKLNQPKGESNYGQMSCLWFNGR